jgi:hypothetical protein
LIGAVFVFWATTAFATERFDVVELKHPLKIELPIPMKNSQVTSPGLIKKTGDPKIRFLYMPTGLSTRSETVATLYRLKEVSTLDSAAAHLAAAEGAKVTLADFEAAGAVSSFESKTETIYTFDLGKLNPQGGTTAVYILAKNPKHGALLLRPLDYLNFDWSKLKIRWK